MSDYYKPLTPSFREDINNGFNTQIEELRACSPNVLVAAQIEALKTYQKLINGLPDGFPIPIKERK